MRSGFFVTGTDTGVGKTVAACALVRGLRARGVAVGVMKPVETGVDERGPQDALALTAAADETAPLADVCPFQLALPAAPSVAAAAEQSPVSLEGILQSYDRIASRGCVMVVEGAGGLRVPITDELDMADLALALELPAVLVARARLGTINHTLLTVSELERRHVPLAGVIVSHADGPISHADASNLDFLRSALAERLVGEIPPLAPQELPKPDAIDVEALLAAARQ
jgi:dethiobiotin synthetase